MASFRAFILRSDLASVNLNSPVLSLFLYLFCLSLVLLISLGIPSMILLSWQMLIMETLSFPWWIFHVSQISLYTFYVKQKLKTQTGDLDQDEIDSLIVPIITIQLIATTSKHYMLWHYKPDYLWDMRCDVFYQSRHLTVLSLHWQMEENTKVFLYFLK